MPALGTGRRHAIYRAGMRTTAALLLTVIFATTACSSSGEGGSATVFGDVMTVSLVEAGDDTRLLRYRPEEGAVERVTMEFGVDFDMEVDGQPLPDFDVPVLGITMAMTVEEVADDGAVTVGFAFEDLGVVGDADPAVATALEEAAADIRRITGTVRMTDRGIVLDASIDIPAGVDPALRSTLEEMESQFDTAAVPLPEDPVGVGAAWEGTIAVETNGVETHATYRYEVTEIEGDRVTVDVRSTQSVPPQEAELDGMPAGTSARVTEGSFTGSGRMTMEPTVLFSLGSIDAEGQMAMEISDGADTGELVMDLDLSFTISRLD